MFNIKQCLSMVLVVNWSNKIEHVSLESFVLFKTISSHSNVFLWLSVSFFIHFLLFIVSFRFFSSSSSIIAIEKRWPISICVYNAKHFVIYNLFIHRRRSIPIINSCLVNFMIFSFCFLFIIIISSWTNKNERSRPTKKKEIYIYLTTRTFSCVVFNIHASKIRDRKKKRIYRISK